MGDWHLCDGHGAVEVGRRETLSGFPGDSLQNRMCSRSFLNHKHSASGNSTWRALIGQMATDGQSEGFWTVRIFQYISLGRCCYFVPENKLFICHTVKYECTSSAPTWLIPLQLWLDSSYAVGLLSMALNLPDKCSGGHPSDSQPCAQTTNSTLTYMCVCMSHRRLRWDIWKAAFQCTWSHT